MQPLANSYLPSADAADPKYPLHARFCDSCLLVQVDPVARREDIFNQGYAYYSSFSQSWLDHCRAYTEAMVARFDLGQESRVIEIASNDGYLLQYFVARGIPVLGIEPSGGVADAARAKGVDTLVEFFGRNLAQRLAGEGVRAHLLAAKNVLAHVPDINDFVAGIALILAKRGVFTVEFPHLLNMIRLTQFDTIYHEHFTYLSLLAVQNIMARHGLSVIDADELTTHGGSLRLYVARDGEAPPATAVVRAIAERERAAGLDARAGYADFAGQARRLRGQFRDFVAGCREKGKRVAAHGAAAKGNTFLNYCDVGADEIDFVVDRNPAKQDTFLPGSRIPVLPPEALHERRPDYLLILPWNLRDEIIAQNADFRAAGGQFVTAIPELKIS